MNKEQEISYKWYKERINKYRTAKQKRDSEEYRKMERRAIKEGSFIMFNYKNPVGKDKKTLRWFDENPVNVILRLSGNDMLCLNFHFSPRVFRKSILEFIFKLNKFAISKDKRFELTYQEMKEYLKRNGLELMIHRYKVNRITNLQYIKLSEVKYIAEIPSEKFIIQDKSITEEDLYNMIRSHSRQSKKAKNTRFGRPVK